MDAIDKWLKSLRLHKYTHLFKTLTYEQMLNLEEKYLIEKEVTKGARNKMLVSVKKLNLRRERLVNMMDDLDQDNISMKEALTVLKDMLVTPIPPPPPQPYSPSTNYVDPHELTYLFIETFEKVARRSIESPSMEDSACHGIMTAIVDDCLKHNSFTIEQKAKVASFKQHYTKEQRAKQVANYRQQLNQQRLLHQQQQQQQQNHHHHHYHHHQSHPHTHQQHQYQQQQQQQQQHNNHHNHHHHHGQVVQQHQPQLQQHRLRQRPSNGYSQLNDNIGVSNDLGLNQPLHYPYCTTQNQFHHNQFHHLQHHIGHNSKRPATQNQQQPQQICHYNTSSANNNHHHNLWIGPIQRPSSLSASLSTIGSTSTSDEEEQQTYKEYSLLRPSRTFELPCLRALATAEKHNRRQLCFLSVYQGSNSSGQHLSPESANSVMH